MKEISLCCSRNFNNLKISLQFHFFSIPSRWCCKTVSISVYEKNEEPREKVWVVLGIFVNFYLTIEFSARMFLHHSPAVFFLCSISMTVVTSQSEHQALIKPDMQGLSWIVTGNRVNRWSYFYHAFSGKQLVRVYRLCIAISSFQQKV